MFVCDNVNQLIALLNERKIIIYGSGYIAGIFLNALEKHGLEKNMFCFVTSEFAKTANRSMERYEIKPIDEITVTEDMVVCIAVHDCYVNEIESALKSRGVSNYIWIYPYFFDLYYGTPIKKGESISLEKLLPKEEGRYALALRWAAVADYYGKCPNGFMWYKRAMESLHNALAAESRIKIFKQLIQNWEKDGYDGKHEIAINDRYEVIDGEHRMAVALYHGEKVIKCRVYKGENINSEKSFMKREMLMACGFNEEEIQFLDRINNQIYLGLHEEGTLW